MLSEEQEKEINAKMDSLADEYMKREIPNATWDNVENLSFAFTYKKTANLVKLSENLVKQSSRLTKLTWALFVTALGMIGLAIWQLLVLFQV